MNSIENEIVSVLDKIRPYLQSDGGDVEFVSFNEGTVVVRMLGACSDCDINHVTLKDGVEQILIEEIPGVFEVILEEASLSF